MRFRIVSIIGLLSLAFVFVLGVAPAAAINGAHINSVTITCTSITVDYDQINYDRDTTGENREEHDWYITDGNGHRLLLLGEVVYVGDNDPAGTRTFTFEKPPTANPIRMHFYSVADHGFAQQDIWDFSGDCADLPPSGNKHGAPGIPAGFVFKTVICDTPVYNTAAGQPVGDAHVDAGQTWYVNPKPVDGDDGKSWTEIFVSSTTNPWIPTACVQ